MEINWTDNKTVSCHGYVFIYPGYKRPIWTVYCYSLQMAIFSFRSYTFFFGNNLLKLLPET